MLATLRCCRVVLSSTCNSHLLTHLGHLSTPSFLPLTFIPLCYLPLSSPRLLLINIYFLSLCLLTLHVGTGPLSHVSICMQSFTSPRMYSYLLWAFLISVVLSVTCLLRKSSNSHTSITNKFSAFYALHSAPTYLLISATTITFATILISAREQCHHNRHHQHHHRHHQ
jgi:hypothetical protein